ncbi:histidine kinase N-terminal 7TM domain-containing protein [Haloarcula marina]|uniref:histidine kinase N-terminal 7TM domain-containing protein n=1 Tax=Haloarcula marina TaxID=2961574 RepID=UPI0020B70A52|nr:histidine kinase N-terminal 7TM domain-containing protein [Halomicroarcula marina]
MVSLYVVYAISLLAIGVFVAALAAFVWQQKHHDGATPLAVLLAGQSIWCACAFAAIVTRGTRWALVWSRAWYAGIVIVVAGLFVFALTYTGRDRYLGRWTYAALAVEPVVLFWFSVFDPTGPLYTVVGPSSTTMLGWELQSGPVFWAHAAYSYLLVAVASALIIEFALTSNSLRQRQVYGLVVAIFVPWFGNGLYLFGGLGFDPTPVAFAVTGVALTWSVVKAGLLDISPVAHRAVVESLNSGVFVIDTDETIIEANDRAMALLEDDTVVGTSVETALSSWPSLYDQYRRLTDSSEHECVMEQSERYFDVQASPLYDDRGQLLGRVFLVHEITDQKARQRELERRNSQLDQFAGVVSHDLRNPLNVASASVSLAEETGDTEHFDRLRRAHQRMEHLIDEVLALARDDAALDTSPLSLSDVAETAWATVDTVDASLTVETDRRVVADRDQLLRLFENAFRNSVEHGARDVSVTVTATDGGFGIADDGPGVPPDERGTVFDYGYTTSDAGTGLGLAIVDHVAGSHGWDVAVSESDDGGFRLEVTGVETVAVSSPRQ